jgi:hypothetical protein
MIEKPSFPPELSTIANQVSLCPNHSMTRNDNRDRIASVGSTNCSGSLMIPHIPGDLLVGSGFTIGDPNKMGPYTFLKGGSPRSQLQIKDSPFPLKILIEL